MQGKLSYFMVLINFNFDEIFLTSVECLPRSQMCLQKCFWSMIFTVNLMPFPPLLDLLPNVPIFSCGGPPFRT